jgi:polyisoprenoid-binding protein YceI
MKYPFLLLMIILHASLTEGQKFISEKSSVTFYSSAAIEDIKAVNQSSVSLFNVETGETAFSIPVKDFKFDKSLMQEHFNEKYLETEKFPKSTFEGFITGYDGKKSGVQEAKAAGKLTIHGVTREVQASGTVEISNNKISIESKFMVKLEDYAVPRPQLLWKNIAEQVEITIEFTYKPYEKK